MKQYLKNYIWEYIACFIICGTLIINIAQGFYIPDSMADSVIMAFGLSAVLVFLFYLTAYNRVSAIIGLAASAAIVVGAFLIMRARGLDIIDEEESESSYLIYWFIFAIVCIAVFFTTRFRAGVIIVFLAGAGASAVMEYLEYESKTWTTVLFCLACAALFMLRQYRVTAINSSTSEPKFGRFAASAAVLVLAAGLTGSGVYYAVIKPLNPPTQSIKFFERFSIYDIFEMLGITDSYEITDPDEETDKDDEEESKAEEEEEEETTGNDEQPDDSWAIEQPDSGVNADGVISLRTLVLNLTTLGKIILIIILALLVFGIPPLVKHLLRKRKMKKLEAIENREQVMELYRFYLRKLKALGEGKYKWETPDEYRKRAGERLDRYLKDTCGLDHITGMFTDTRYGGAHPDDAQCQRLREVYPKLLKNAKQQLGFFKYAAKYYVL